MNEMERLVVQGGEGTVERIDDGASDGYHLSCLVSVIKAQGAKRK
jgi:hypothetical protein